MSSVQASRRLGDDVDNPFRCEPGCLVADEFIQGDAREQRHHKERLDLPSFFDYPVVVEIHYIRMTKLAKRGALRPEHVQ